MRDALTIENLSVGFRNGKVVTPILKNVTFSVPAGKTVALVGESGSGKSTIGTAIMGLLPANTVKSGRIVFRDPHGKNDVDLTTLSGAQYRRLRGSGLAMAFQEPSAALSPVVSIGAMLVETIQVHERLSASRARRRAIEVLAQVGFPDAAAAFNRYPFELSGGLRQRAMLASALVCKPTLVVADEPTSALDVTVQAL